jgi:hypothetical protein
LPFERLILVVVGLGPLAAAAGCSAVRVPNSLATSKGGSSPAQQMAFWHSLPERPLACNDDAFHALLLVIDHADSARDYAGRVWNLNRRGILPAGFDRPGNEAVTRGNLAVAIARGLQVKGGWAMAVFGPTPRYATRELVYLGIYPPSSPWQTLTGSELLGIMGKVDDRRRPPDEQLSVAGVDEASTPPTAGVAPLR